MVIGEARAHRRILGQFDDAFMRIAQLELAHRAHHAVGFLPADRALAQFHPVGRDHRARQAEHALHPCTRIGRAADHLQRLAVTGIDGQHLKLVGIGMRRGGQHLGDAEARQPLRGILDPLDLVADRTEGGGDLGGRCLGGEEVAEPFEREFHARAPTPPASVGWSKGEKP